jgi:hypothetical protein
MGGCISKMVGVVVPWYRDIPAQVRGWFIAQTGAGCLIHRRMLEIRPNLAAHHFERRCSGQFSPIGNDRHPSLPERVAQAEPFAKVSPQEQKPLKIP